MRFILILATFFSFKNAQATTEKDFYCGEFTLIGAAYSESRLKECSGATEEAKGICSLTVPCIFLNDDLKTITSQMDAGQKHNYFKAYFSTNKNEWTMSTLTCKAEKPPTLSSKAICPVPEKCKGDLYYNSSPAETESVETQAIITRLNGDPANNIPPTTRSFPVHHQIDDPKAAEPAK